MKYKKIIFLNHFFSFFGNFEETNIPLKNKDGKNENKVMEFKET